MKLLAALVVFGSLEIILPQDLYGENNDRGWDQRMEGFSGDGPVKPMEQKDYVIQLLTEDTDLLLQNLKKLYRNKTLARGIVKVADTQDLSTSEINVDDEGTENNMERYVEPEQGIQMSFRTGSELARPLNSDETDNAKHTHTEGITTPKPKVEDAELMCKKQQYVRPQILMLKTHWRWKKLGKQEYLRSRLLNSNETDGSAVRATDNAKGTDAKNNPSSETDVVEGSGFRDNKRRNVKPELGRRMRNKLREQGYPHKSLSNSDETGDSLVHATDNAEGTYAKNISFSKTIDAKEPDAMNNKKRYAGPQIWRRRPCLMRNKPTDQRYQRTRPLNIDGSDGSLVYATRNDEYKDAENVTTSKNDYVEDSGTMKNEERHAEPQIWKRRPYLMRKKLREQGYPRTRLFNSSETDGSGEHARNDAEHRDAKNISTSKTGEYDGGYSSSMHDNERHIVPELRRRPYRVRSKLRDQVHHRTRLLKSDETGDSAKHNMGITEASDAENVTTSKPDVEDEGRFLEPELVRQRQYWVRHDLREQGYPRIHLLNSNKTNSSPKHSVGNTEDTDIGTITTFKPDVEDTGPKNNEGRNVKPGLGSRMILRDHRYTREGLLNSKEADGLIKHTGVNVGNDDFENMLTSKTDVIVTDFISSKERYVKPGICMHPPFSTRKKLREDTRLLNSKGDGYYAYTRGNTEDTDITKFHIDAGTKRNITAHKIGQRLVGGNYDNEGGNVSKERKDELHLDHKEINETEVGSGEKDRYDVDIDDDNGNSSDIIYDKLYSDVNESIVLESGNVTHDGAVHSDGHNNVSNIKIHDVGVDDENEVGKDEGYDAEYSGAKDADGVADGHVDGTVNEVETNMAGNGKEAGVTNAGTGIVNVAETAKKARGNFFTSVKSDVRKGCFTHENPDYMCSKRCKLKRFILGVCLYTGHCFCYNGHEPVVSSVDRKKS